MAAKALAFCGQTVTGEELAVIRRLVEIYGGLSRTELASTVCELLGWERPNGGLKTIECRQFLESLHERSVIAAAGVACGPPARLAHRGDAQRGRRSPRATGGHLARCDPAGHRAGTKPMPIGPCGGSWWNAITTWVIGYPSAPIFAT